MALEFISSLKYDTKYLSTQIKKEKKNEFSRPSTTNVSIESKDMYNENN